MHRSFQLAWLLNKRAKHLKGFDFSPFFSAKREQQWICFNLKKIESDQEFFSFSEQNRTEIKSLYQQRRHKTKSVEFILFLLYEFIHVHSNVINRCIFLLNAKWNCKIRSFPMWATLKGNSFLRRCKFMIIYMMIEVHRFPNVNTLFPHWKSLRFYTWWLSRYILSILFENEAI